jgi:hypothetical protein
MFTNCYCQETKPNTKKSAWELRGLKGKGKSLKVIGYSAIIDSGQLHKGEIIEDTWGFNNTLVKYDEKGNWTEYSSYKPDGTNIRLEVMKYDREGNFLGMDVYNYGNIEHRRVFTTDNNGNIITMLHFDANDSLFANFFYRYNENDYEIEAYRYTSTDSLIYKTVSNYDKNGKLIESLNYGADEHLTSKTLYQYDNLGNRIESATYNSDENLLERTINQYNEQGLVIEVNIFNSKDNSNTKTIYKYEKYDKNGNWIERIEYKDDVVVKISERQIEYYE